MGEVEESDSLIHLAIFHALKVGFTITERQSIQLHEPMILGKVILYCIYVFKMYLLSILMVSIVT